MTAEAREVWLKAVLAQLSATRETHGLLHATFQVADEVVGAWEKRRPEPLPWNAGEDPRAKLKAEPWDRPLEKAIVALAAAYERATGKPLTRIAVPAKLYMTIALELTHQPGYRPNSMQLYTGSVGAMMQILDLDQIDP